MNSTGLPAWLQRLEVLHPTEIELGLARVSTVAGALGLLPPKVPVVSIAGTNGKGSTAAALESLLLAAGHTPGVYTSPHLLRYNERIRVAGDEATDREIVAAFEAIEAARGTTSLTYFEFSTLAALLVFRDRGCDVLVLEVGLGGRLDAVNIIDADVAVITSIGLDHQHWLGDTRDAVAREKAGILRPGAPAVIAEADPPEALVAEVERLACRARWIGADFHCEVADGRWRMVSTGADGAGTSEWPAVPVGAVVPSNLCAALQALDLLGLSPAGLDPVTTLGELQPPARLQRLQIDGREFVLDVAHNPDAIDKLLEYVSLSPCYGKTIALFSAMEDKDIRGMIARARGAFDAWFVADQPGNTRAASGSDLAARLHEAGEGMISVSKNLRQALARARSLMSTGDRLIVFGSFFTVAAVLPVLDRDLDRGDR